MKPIIILGAGLAGYSVAREFRKIDKTTPLAIITADHGCFYSKPMLSNAFAKGKSAEQLITQTALRMAADLSATITTGASVSRIDSLNKVIHTNVGTFPYEKLVIASGAQPTQLSISGDGTEQLQSINHINDYIDFRIRIGKIAQTKPARVVILGAGLIGCEFANDLADAGHSVILVDPNSRPLANLAPPALSYELQSALVTRGVGFRLDATATAINKTQNGLQITLSQGMPLTADVVLSAIGLKVDLTLARTAKLAIGRGILVDAIGKTNAQDIYAVGDCAEYTTNNRSETRWLPYVMPLMTAAKAIARTLAGYPTVIEIKPTPVIVKTPCYPLTLVPPPIHQENGCWITEQGALHKTCRFYDADGMMRGFGIASHDLTVRQELLAALGTSLQQVEQETVFLPQPLLY